MVRGFYFILFALLVATPAMADNTLMGRDLVQVTGLACDSISYGRLTKWAAKTHFYETRVSMDGIKYDKGVIRSKKHAIKLEHKDGRMILAANGRKVTGNDVCDLIVNFAESEAAEKVSLFSALVPTAHAQNLLDQQAAAQNAAALNANSNAASNANSNSAVSTTSVPETVASSNGATPAAPATPAVPAETAATPATPAGPAPAAAGPELIAGANGGTTTPEPSTLPGAGRGVPGATVVPGNSRSKIPISQNATSVATAVGAAAVATGVAQANQAGAVAIASQPNPGAITADQIRGILSALNNDVNVKCGKKKVTIEIGGRRIIINRRKGTVRIAGRRKNQPPIPNQQALVEVARSCRGRAQAEQLEAQFRAALTGSNVAVAQSEVAASQIAAAQTQEVSRMPASVGGGAPRESKTAQRAQ